MSLLFLLSFFLLLLLRLFSEAEKTSTHPVVGVGGAVRLPLLREL